MSAVGIAFLLLLVGTSSAGEKLPPEGKFLPINDFEMYYEIHGEGEPLLQFFKGEWEKNNARR